MKNYLIGLALILVVTLNSCKTDTNVNTEKVVGKEYREITYDTLFEYSAQIEYVLKTKDYVFSYHISKGFDTWYSDLEFNVPLGKDYRLNIDGKELYYEKYHDGSGSGLKDGFNAIAANGSKCTDCISDTKYIKEYDRINGINFEVYIINQMRNAKKVTLQVVGEKPKELKIQKDATEFMLAYNKSTSIKVDWIQLEKDKYKIR
jgi:hypothetical protein